MSSLLPALADINIPKQIKIEVKPSLEALMSEVLRRSMMGFSGDPFFGTAFVQGSRLQFTTAMPISKMVAVSAADRSRKKSNVGQVSEHSNRPEEKKHSKHILTYLLKTACTGEKFILPPFTFNYGVSLDDDAPDALLLIFGSAHDGANAWPAILIFPQGAKLDTTDGAHRRGVLADLLSNPKIDDAHKDALKRNAVSVVIVFEPSRRDSHQDFADCGKAKSIAKSLVTTFDIRDRRNDLTRQLVMSHDFLAHYVDATASNVNLTARSTMVWSMTAVRMFVAHVVEHHPNDDAAEDVKLAGAAEFFTALVERLPQLRALDQARHEKSAKVKTGDLREKRGGDVALRAIGMAIFARAYLHCQENAISFDDMAARLATLDWHLLSCERDKLPDDPETYNNEVFKKAVPLWSCLLVIGELRYRISSSSADADEAWKRMLDKLESTAAAPGKSAPTRAGKKVAADA